jgi:hypothetical protein
MLRKSGERRRWPRRRCYTCVEFVVVKTVVVVFATVLVLVWVIVVLATVVVTVSVMVELATVVVTVSVIVELLD